MNKDDTFLLITGKYTVLILFVMLFCMQFLFPTIVASEESNLLQGAESPKKLTLGQITMCEEIVDHGPQNPAIVFSIKRQQIYCFSSFDYVPEKSYVYHNWYREQNLSTKIKLLLQPPRWATFSRIQLREADRGPWRVEITDQDDNVLKILRFSVTD